MVGSNILLDRIPNAGRIELVEGGEAIPREEARNKFKQTVFLSEEDEDTRDWTIAMMDHIDELYVQPGEQFELADVYEFEERLAELYPENQHIRAKIRQQLQVLRTGTPVSLLLELPMLAAVANKYQLCI